jgi:allophanate hydrolase subunit 1
MRYLDVVWNDEQGSNTEHVLEHGFTKADVEHVIENPASEAYSDSSGRPCFVG